MMRFHSLIIDDFLDDPSSARAEAKKLSYLGVVSPFDGVHYPDISVQIPKELLTEYHLKLQRLLGREIEKSTDFIRLSVKGVLAPHQAHTDTIMGDYTALVYLNTSEQCQGGTSILEHICGMRSEPKNELERKIWEKDTNREEQWKTVMMCPMRLNRLFLVDSALFHRSEPIGGFGDSIENGRLVLISFFTLR